MQIAVVLALVALASAAPQQRAPLRPDEQIPILKYSNEGTNSDGSYQYRYAFISYSSILILCIDNKKLQTYIISS